MLLNVFTEANGNHKKLKYGLSKDKYNQNFSRFYIIYELAYSVNSVDDCLPKCFLCSKRKIQFSKSMEGMYHSKKKYNE